MPVSNKQSEQVPYWRSDCGRAVVYVGDNMPIMVRIERDQFHAVVSDPPYNLSFMSREWDSFGDGKQYQQWFYDRTTQVLRVCKPGAHFLSFGGTRMYHRMACAVEDAGFEVRDTIMWVYGSGFPKGQDVSKAIDKMLGAERKDVLTEEERGRLGGRFGNYAQTEIDGGYGFKENWTRNAPVTNEAKQWDGWNTALKPALEPIIMARKPIHCSVAENVLENGCGAVNVDGCRVGTTGTDVERYVATKTSTGSGVYGFNAGEAGSESMQGDFVKVTKDGRWPSNVILTHHPECRVVGKRMEKGNRPSVFTDSGGVKGTFGLSDTTVKKREGQVWPGRPDREVDEYDCHVDCPMKMLNHQAGDDVARFFYSAKANDSDRSVVDSTIHPTVKPLDLMRYLVRLVCPKGGTVLDPFMGSGSTGCAAIAEGMYFVGIEQSKEYADVAVDRLKEMLGIHPLVERLASGKRVVRDTPPPPKELR